MKSPVPQSSVQYTAKLLTRAVHHRYVVHIVSCFTQPGVNPGSSSNEIGAHHDQMR